MKQKTVNAQKLLITQQEMVLIKASNEAKDTELYGNLYECIVDYKKLSKAELDNNVVFDKKARTVLMNPDNKKMMMNKIMEEWYSVKNFDVSDTLKNCQLCGRPNKYIFYIHNKITDIDLHIGSDCVKNFPDITGIKQQKKKLSQLQREQTQQKRKIEFEMREGDEIGFIDDVERMFKEFPIMLPYQYYNGMKSVIYQLNLSKTSFIKCGGNLDEVYSTYCMLKEEFSDLYIKADEYYKKMQNNSLVCDRETAEWLLKNNQLVWERVSKNGGIFTEETLMKIYDDRYIRKKIPEIMKHLTDKDIKFLQVSKFYIHFSIKNSRYVYPITFFMPIKKFMECIGCYALTNKQYEFSKEDLSDIAIEVTNKNFEAVYNSVLVILNKNGYDFIIEEKTSQAYWKKLAQCESTSRWSNRVIQIEPMYKKSSIAVFLKTLSHFLLKSESFLEKNFSVVVRNMEKGQAWITQKEKNDYEEAARYARGMQKQKEFIPY